MSFSRSLPRVGSLRSILTPVHLALVLIVLLAATLRFANLATVGNANPYYTAAVTAMLRSWSNFFFVAAEPGGSVSLDKPPLGFWIQTLSASLFGVNGFAVVLPQLLAGIASILLLFHLVRRSFGDLAGLLAALLLAVTPVAIAVERNNTPDALLILTLLLAAWAFLKATETGRLRTLLLGALLVGVGFNIKMLQAFLPLPAFYALYLFGAQQPWRRKLRNLTLATLLLIPVSLSWALIVDLTPADQRPYMGGSSTNSALELIVGYNGLQRLLGGAGPAPTSARPSSDQLQPPGSPPPGSRPDAPGGPPMGGGTNGSGMFGTGQAGALRLFQAGLAAQVSWLLPFGLIALGAMLLKSSWRQPSSALHHALILWGGWLLTSALFFSVAGFFHQYYLVMLGPPLAAVVAIGVTWLWRLRQSHPVQATLLLIVASVVTLVFQIYAVALYQSLSWWVALPAIMGLGGGGMLLFSLRTQRRGLPPLALTLLLAALLTIPTVWSAFTTAYVNTSSSLTQAYSGSAFIPGMGGPSGAPPNSASGPMQGEVNQNLLDYLQAHTQDTTYLLLVPSSQVGAGYVLATGRPVFYAGGFNGSDPVIDGDGVANLVERGEVRYVLWGNAGPNRTTNASISSYLQTACSVVDDPTLLLPAGDQPQRGGPGGASTLYQCGDPAR